MNLDKYSELLRSGTKSELVVEAESLFAAGVHYEEMVVAFLKVLSERAANPTFLQGISVINLSDSLVHVDLQEVENKHRVVVIGSHERDGASETPTQPLNGSTEELTARFSEAVDDDKLKEGIGCLLGLVDQTDVPTVIKTLFTCALRPQYLGNTGGSWWAGVRHQSLGCMVELWQKFGDDPIHDIVCHVGAKKCLVDSNIRDDRSPAVVVSDRKAKRFAAIELLESEFAKLETIERPVSPRCEFDEPAFREKLRSGDFSTMVDAITVAWRDGVAIEKIDLAMTMHCVERLARAGHGSGANWDHLKRELLSTAVIRKANVLDEKLAIKSAYHAAWQFARHGEAGLGELSVVQAVPAMMEPNGPCEVDYAQSHAGRNRVCRCVEWSDPIGAVRVANDYVARGHEGRAFLQTLILHLQDKVGGGFFAGQRGMIDAWELAVDHPERHRILIALAGWAADYQKQHRKHRKHYGPIWGANISSDGSLIAFCSGGMRVYDVESREEVAFSPGSPWRFAFSPDSHLVANGWDSPTEGIAASVEVWDLATKERVAELDAFGVDGKFWGLSFSPDGAMLGGVGRNEPVVKIWDTSTWQLKYELAGHGRTRTESVTFSDDSKVIASGGNDGTVRVWDAADGRERLVFNVHKNPKGRISGLQFHPDGERIVSCESDEELIVWNWQTGKQSFVLDIKGYCNCAGFTADGKQVISEHDGVVYYHDADTGEFVDKFVAIPFKPNDHTIFGGANQSLDRRRIVTAGWHGLIKVWDVDKREQLMSFQLDV